MKHTVSWKIIRRGVAEGRRSFPVRARAADGKGYLKKQYHSYWVSRSKSMSFGEVLAAHQRGQGIAGKGFAIAFALAVSGWKPKGRPGRKDKDEAMTAVSKEVAEGVVRGRNGTVCAAPVLDGNTSTVETGRSLSDAAGKH